MSNKYDWSEMIKYLSDVRGITKADIARNTGLSASHIFKLISGKRGKSISFDGGMALIEFYNSEVKKEKRANNAK